MRQGKSAEETAVLIRSSTMMSKLGNMEAADSTEKLTSMMNGFKIKAEDTGEIVNKLVGLDNSYASSVDRIATAMKYSSNVAQQVGVDFDHLAAYVTVISHVTQQSSETIGQALRSIFSRMTAVRSGLAMDEEGQSLNLVEKSLKRVDINLRDANGSFRNMQDVIAEIASRWKDIGEQDAINGTENQAFIAQQIAGKIYARTCGNTRVKYILIIDKFQIL